MRTILTALIASTVATQAADESANYLNFIIQIQNNKNKTTHKMDDITPNGNGTALKGVTKSSTFQLWTIHRETGKEYLLDEKIVSAYHPKATITITSQDPYTGIPRTRVDHPFEVKYKINGLKVGQADAPAAAKSVTLQHVVTSYGAAPADDNQQTGGGLLGGLVGGIGGAVDDTVGGLLSVLLPEVEMTKNGITKETRMTSIQADDLTTASGEETFTIFAKPDYGVEESAMLANAKVQIWPIAQGSITGFESGQPYNKLPDIKIDLKDLYPSSTTYVRAYKGDPTDSPVNPIIINTSYIIIDDVKTVDREFALTGLDAFMSEAGTYTLELLHVTPFGVDMLYQTSGDLVKKDSIKVIGTLGGSE